MIQLQNIKKRFGTHVAVDDVSLTIPAGQIFGIIGPNGAGKSTLFRLLCQLIPPDSGRIEVFGETDELAIKRQIGYLPEEHRLYEHMKTLDYLSYFCELLGLPNREAVQALEKVKLIHKAQEQIRKLSKGMRQKVAFARTLLGSPPVLILDEPMYGLDPSTSQEMRGWILEEAKQKVVLLSSHNLHEAERICDTVAILHRGRVAAVGTPRALVQELKQSHLIEVGFRGESTPIRQALEPLPLLVPPAFSAQSVELIFSRSLEPYRVLQLILAAIEQAAEPIAVTGIVPREPTLEDVFFRVTGERFDVADEAGATQHAVSSAPRGPEGEGSDPHTEWQADASHPEGRSRSHSSDADVSESPLQKEPNP